MKSGNIGFSVFGSSHSESIGVRIDGIGFGEAIDMDELNAFMDRRKATSAAYSTKRMEPDEVVFESGIADGMTTGGEIVARIYNVNVKKGDYDFRYLPRPSHADYAAYAKYGDEAEPSGGGRFSGRMTAPMCIAGGIALQILRRKGIFIGAYIQSIGGAEGRSYRFGEVTEEEVLAVHNQRFPLLDARYKRAMEREIEGAASVGDSLGGVVECMIFGMRPGAGDVMLGSIESEISKNVFAVPAVKGVEFGSGFKLAAMRASGANDEFSFDKDGRVITTTNHNGGINGGLANGMPIAFRVAFKPVPSIPRVQNTVNLKTGQNATIAIKGRHDCCFVPRAVPVIEAMAALAVMNCI